MRKIAKQAVVRHTFMAFQKMLGLPEMVKLLPVAREWLRKQNF